MKNNGIFPGVLLIVLVLLWASTAYSQISSAATEDDEDVQSWNDLQINIPLAKRLEFYSRLTLRFGKNISRLTDGRHAFGLSWKPISSLTISPFYTFIRARNTAGFFRKEDRYSISAAYKLPFKAVGVTHKSTYERRHRAAGDTWRHRAMLTLDKSLPKSFMEDTKAYVADEVFYDSATGRFSKNRFSVGLTRTISKHVSGDLYYMRQNDGVSHPGDLNIVGFSGRYHL